MIKQTKAGAYPLNAVAAYSREQWYVAGTSAEFGREILARRILDEPLVFFRTEAGEPVALWGLCPHRLMPFALGTLRGDDLVCGYHGFAFATNGACVSIPTAEGISSACRVKSYPLVERGPWVWIWMGEGAPDHGLLPDAGDIGLGAPSLEWRVDITRPFALGARAQLLIDNLLDLSHLAFVHANSTAGGEIALIPPEVREQGPRLQVVRTVPDGPGNALVQWLMPEAGDRSWVELVTDFYNPGLINAGGPWVWRSNPDGTRGPEVGRMNFVHAITPETPNSTHYFGVLTRNFRLNDETLTQRLIAQNDLVRSEDVIVLEAIEKVADRHGDPAREISVKTDMGGLLVRKKLKRMIDGETGESRIGEAA